MSVPVDDLYRAAIKLHQQGQADEAVRIYDEVLRFEPDHYGALHLKGVLALQGGDTEQAIALIERSLAVQPRHGLALANLGVAYRAARRFDEGIAALQKSVALDPNNADAWANLGQMLARTGELREAVAANRRVLELQPTRPNIRQRLLFGENYLAENDPVAAAQRAREFAAGLERSTPARTHYSIEPDPHKKIRLGLLSADLNAHPVGRFLVSTLAALDKSKVEIYAYANSHEADEITAEIKANVACWTNVTGMNDVALDAQISIDKVDILVDLGGYSAGSRLPVFVRRPAPVSFSWLGYFATTGLTTIDYVLANKWVIPEGEENQWVEKVWRMPDTYLCFTAPRDPTPVTAPPALGNGFVTFGSFSNFNKLSDATLAAWSAILAAVPKSRLILRSSGHYPPGIEQRLAGRLAAAGMDVGQVRIDPQIKDYSAHLASYGEIDIGLDPFPYGGTTTTVEAMFMGVPVLMRHGDRYASHMSESILQLTELPDWIAPDAAALPALAALKAGDREALAALRAGLRDRMLASPLFDASRFARNFEDALRQMWRIWCDGRGHI